MLVFIIYILCAHFSYASVIESLGLGADFKQNPSVIEWKKIDTDHFEIIFPNDIESKAQRVAHLLEEVYPVVSSSLEVKPAKIPLILQNQSTSSNALVTLAPRRSEWFTTPAVDPDLTSTEWLKTLAIHEFRHIVQFEKSRQGINKVFEFLFGEIGHALGIGLSMPQWFLEGDAVGIETSLTQGGRGRLPVFERDLRTLLLSGKSFNYDKAHLGSFRDYIPNHYIYGYFYTSFLKNQYGDLFLSKLINRSTSRSYNPLTFYHSYQYLTGEEFEDFYQRTIQVLIKNWTEKVASLSLTPFEVKNVVLKNDWSNYLYPQAVGKNQILALKRGLSDINQFVVIEDQKEKTLFYPGSINNDYPYKLRNNRFAYVELELDPRWGYRDFSLIKVYDLKTQNFVTQISGTKARLAVLDHSAEHVLYVDWDESQGQYLVMRAMDGKEIIRQPFTNQRVITSIDWISEDEIVMVLKDQDDFKQVVKYSFRSKQEIALCSKTQDNLGFVSTFEKRILIESPLSGIDNIFELVDGKFVQLTSSRYGAYAPSVFEGELIYNDYSDTGMNIATKKLPWDLVQKSSDSFVPYFQEDTFKISGSESIFKRKKYPVQKYSQVKNAINLHSWFFIAPPLSPFISVMGISRDVLNNFSFVVGGNYHLIERESEGFVSAIWSHYYPVLDARIAYGGRNQKIIVNNKVIHDHWEEGTFETGLQVPWKRISGRFVHNLFFRTFAKVIKVTNKIGLDLTEINDGALFSPGAQMRYSFTSRKSFRDINSDWGLVVDSKFEEGKDITGVDQRGAIFSLDSRIYLPGFLKHHSFFHQVGYEKQNDRLYQYRSQLLQPRGTSHFFLKEFTKYSGNYTLPVAYPDWNISRYAYLKRVALNLFYDEINGRTHRLNAHVASTGWEIYLDSHFLRIFISITLGIRGNYILNGGEKNSHEIFIATLGGDF